MPTHPGLRPLLKPLDTHPNNLPIQPTPFIGREKEVAAVTQLLRREAGVLSQKGYCCEKEVAAVTQLLRWPEVRLVTLSGPGGVGKTRLALQVAAELYDDFIDGVFIVALAPVNTPEQVVSALAQTLGIGESSDLPLVFNPPSSPQRETAAPTVGGRPQVHKSKNPHRLATPRVNAAHVRVAVQFSPPYQDTRKGYLYYGRCDFPGYEEEACEFLGTHLRPFAPCSSYRTKLDRRLSPQQSPNRQVLLACSPGMPDGRRCCAFPLFTSFPEFS